MYKTRRVTHFSAGGGAAGDTTFPRVSTPAPRRAIDELPDSIYRLIFMHCMDHIKCYTRSRPPVVFLRVCRRWRDIARGTPELWSTIIPSFANPKLISLFIELSANRPLKLHCGPVLSNEDPGLGRRTREIFEVFLLEVHRWQSIMFDLGEPQAKGLTSRFTPGSAPMLTAISLGLDQVPHHSLAPLGRAISFACPNLQSLALADPNGDDDFLQDFPYNRVKHATIGGSLAEEDVVRFISLCRRAETICVNASGTRTLCDAPVSPVLMPLLKRLHLTTHGDPVPTLQSFSFPSLKELSIDVNRPHIEDRGCLVSYFEGAEFKLSRLHLRDGGLPIRAKKEIYKIVALDYDEAVLSERDYAKVAIHPAYRTTTEF